MPFRFRYAHCVVLIVFLQWLNIMMIYRYISTCQSIDACKHKCFVFKNFGIRTCNRGNGIGYSSKWCHWENTENILYNTCASNDQNMVSSVWMHTTRMSKRLFCFTSCIMGKYIFVLLSSILFDWRTKSVSRVHENKQVLLGWHHYNWGRLSFYRYSKWHDIHQTCFATKIHMHWSLWKKHSIPSQTSSTRLGVTRAFPIGRW